MLTVDHISYLIRQKALVNNVSFTAEPGKLIAILGPNGAGKSTLIRLLSREYTPSGGVMTWKGSDFGNFSDQEMALQRAVLTQQIFMSIDFPVREVVLMGRYPHFDNNPRKEDWQAVDNAMEQCGISHLATRDYNSLSGGEQQRVQIARTLAQVNTPSGTRTFLLLDEPLNNLDIRYQHSCLDLVQAYVAGGNTALIVMHDINLAALYAQEILLMSEGKLIAQGPPREVMSEDNLYKAYRFPVRVENHPYHDCPAVYFGCPARNSTTSAEQTTIHKHTNSDTRWNKQHFH